MAVVETPKRTGNWPSGSGFDSRPGTSFSECIAGTKAEGDIPSTDTDPRALRSPARLNGKGLTRDEGTARRVVDSYKLRGQP